MADTALGQCDMVLAVAQDTINLQFHQMWKRGLIRQRWKVLVRAPDGGPAVVRTQEDADFDTTLATWRTVQATLAQLFAGKQYEKFGKELDRARAAGQLWDYGWTGAVDAPAVTVLATDRQDLMLEVAFRSGTLLACPDPTKDLSAWELAGTRYAFKVPVGRLVIDGTHQILTSEARDHAAKVIRESGLTDADFSIEALLLDFENANVADFDAPASTFPAGSTEAIQVAVQDYFKLVVAGEKNPFILGYAMKVKPVAGTALFQPTAARFSTSYSTQPGCSAFNFLMMAGGRDFPAGQDVGVLPASLLEGAGLDSTDDGVFGVDWTLFNGLLIDPFVKAAAPRVAFGFPGPGFSRTAQAWSLWARNTGTLPVHEQWRHLFPWEDPTYLISERTTSSSAALTNASTGLQLSFTMQYTVSILVQRGSPWAGHGEMEYSAHLSTSGTSHPGPGGDAQIGRMAMTIQPGAQGAVSFSIGPATAPVLGFDVPCLAVVGDILTQLYHQGMEHLAEDAIRAAGDLGGTIEGVRAALQTTIDSISTGKVILPLGQLYTFRNIRLRSTDQTDDNAVLMNVAYAPVTA